MFAVTQSIVCALRICQNRVDLSIAMLTNNNGHSPFFPPLHYCLAVQTFGAASRYAAFCNTICMLKLSRKKIRIHFARCFSVIQICKLYIPLQYHRQCFAVFNHTSSAPCVRQFDNPLKLNWMCNEAEGAEMTVCLRYSGTVWYSGTVLLSVYISFWPYHDPGVDSAPSENEYQEHFLGVKAAGAWGWRPHHIHVQNIVKIWEPKPPGTYCATPGLLRDCLICMYLLYVIL
jgi:hypothetical protein